MCLSFWALGSNSPEAFQLSRQVQLHQLLVLLHMCFTYKTELHHLIHVSKTNNKKTVWITILKKQTVSSTERLIQRCTYLSMVPNSHLGSLLKGMSMLWKRATLVAISAEISGCESWSVRMRVFWESEYVWSLASHESQMSFCFMSTEDGSSVNKGDIRSACVGMCICVCVQKHRCASLQEGTVPSAPRGRCHKVLAQEFFLPGWQTSHSPIPESPRPVVEMHKKAIRNNISVSGLNHTPMWGKTALL